MRQILSWAAVTGTLLVTSLAHADEILFLTEQYRPLNWQDADGIHGISIDILGEIFERTEYPATVEDVQFQPWTRAYDTALNQPNTAIFAAVRTEAREDLFQWVGPIFQTEVAVFVPEASAQAIHELDDLDGLTIGTVNDDVGEQLLVAAGFGLDTFDRASGLAPNLQKLAAGRIDAVAGGDAAIYHTMAELGFQRSDYVAAVTLFEGQAYFAFNLDTDPAVIEAFQVALDAIIEDGTRDEIVASYLH